MNSSNTLVTLIFLITLVVSGTCGNEYGDIDYGIEKNNLPQTSDLLVYLKALRKTVEFCLKYKQDIDLNFEFGLFLLDVNLKNVMINKRIRLPKALKKYIRLLLKENDQLLEFFGQMVRDNRDTSQKFNKLIFSLFSNDTLWVNQIRKFDAVPFADPDETQTDYIHKFSSWSQYMNNIQDVDNWMPFPQLSDMCMISLAGSNDVQEYSRAKCQVYEPCFDMLINGTNFGYALTHRLLFLLNARNGRGCSILSPQKDNQMTERFCAMAYTEAEYIAEHSFGIVDLYLEQACICAQNGYAQFLQRHWLANVLHFQTSYGCFGSKIHSMEAKHISQGAHQTWKLAKEGNHTIMGGLCDGHVTAVAAATLASAVRYILETYFT